MKYRKIIIFLLCLDAIFSSTSLLSKEYFNKTETLTLAFPEADTVEEKTVILNEEKVKKIKEKADIKEVTPIFSYYQGVKNNETRGFAVISKAKGKIREFTFICVFNPKLEIEKVEVLKYEEVYGSQIRQKNFLSQFFGKSVKDILHISKDIQPISGATISSRAITDKIKEIMVYMDVINPPASFEKK